MFSNRFVATVIVALFFAFAGTVASAQQGVDRFKFESDCIAAIKEGRAKWYQPSFFDHRNRLPSLPVAITRPLEERACADMWIVGGWHFVPQAGVPQLGEEAPKFDFDAEGRPIRRSDCGNRIRKIVYVPVPPSPPPPAPLIDTPPQPQLGCIEVVKETVSPDNVFIRPVAQFTFRLDGGEVRLSDSAGRARFEGVALGTHTVEENVPNMWNLVQVTPEGGQVTVSAGEPCATVLFKNRQVLPPARQQISFSPTPRPEPRVEKSSKRWPWVVAAIAGGVVAGGVLATRGGGGHPLPASVVGKPNTGVNTGGVP